MRRINDIRIGPRLIGGFTSVALLCAFVGLGGLATLRSLQSRLDAMYTGGVVPLELLKTVSDRYAIDVVDLTNKASNGLIQFPNAQRGLAESRRVIEVTWTQYRTAIDSDQERKMADEAETLMRNADERLDALRDMLVAQDYSALSIFVATELYATIDPITEKIQELSALQLAEARQTNEEAAARYAQTKVMAWILISAAVLLALGLGITLTRTITGRLALVVERAERVRSVALAGLERQAQALARGDLDAHVDAHVEPLGLDMQDELGELGRALDSIIVQAESTVRSSVQAREVVGALVSETSRLTEAGRAGQLSVRGDAARFEGAYRDLVDGVNQTLDAVTAPVEEATRALERLAARDLTVRVTGEYRGDHARLKDAMNEAIANLEDVLREVWEATEEVASASDQISRGSQQLASGASDQASTLEEVASSLQELSSMARQNVGNAKEAKSLADGARGSATRGVERMRTLTTAMEKIKASSDATAKIVRTIDEIAFQTNRLALTAAVEAARAGDAGRGFAVVAEEVRSLAQRSAEAAKNTASLIEESVRNAESGVDLNADVLMQLGEINGHVNRVGEVVAEIAAASEQQSDGVAQINGAVEQMNSVTQAVASNSEESAAAAEELSGQSDRVRELVSSFTLRGAGEARRREQSGSGPSQTRSKDGGRRPKNGRTPRNGGRRQDAATLIPLDDQDLAALGEF